ncbi:MAG: radical SAM protein [Planctomycetes bacterium]|nr:radical SAM protein [Planctomycetota bacterium]
MPIAMKNATTADEVLAALRAGDFSHEALRAALLMRGGEQEKLFELARECRDRCFPDKRVEVRSVIEISNICRQGCRYCNMGRKRDYEHYIIQLPAFMKLVEHIYRSGRRVLLLQSGENSAQSFVEHVALCVEEVKKRYPDMLVILCLGNLSRTQYHRLRQAGGDRYILKFETSNPELYSHIKPFDKLDRRLTCLQWITEEGFTASTGNIVGLPGQTLDDIVEDLLLIKKLKLSMMSCSPFIPAENSEFGDQPMGDLDTALNTMALLRIMNPHTLMPTTSALEKVGHDGQYRGLMAGANTVTIHDGTPEDLKQLFPIYSVSRVRPTQEHFEEIVHRAGLKM